MMMMRRDAAIQAYMVTVLVLVETEKNLLLCLEKSVYQKELL